MHPLLSMAPRLVVGHRGNCAHAPENTLESFRQAVALGVDALEFDVRLTADGNVVVMHDPGVERTTDGRGLVRERTLAELRRLDAGARFSTDGGRTTPYAGRGIAVPSFDEVLDAFPLTSLLIEIKTAEASAELRRRIEERGAGERCIVASFQPGAMEPFRGSRIATGATQAETARLYLPALLRVPPRDVSFGCMSLPRFHRGLPLPLGGYASILAPLGVPVHCWTVNDPVVARTLWRRGVHGILSDDPATILAVRGER